MTRIFSFNKLIFFVPISTIDVEYFDWQYLLFINNAIIISDYVD